MSEPNSYTIQLPVYEGPLDLLLELIEKAELDITKVALAQVTDQYLDYLRQIPDHQLDDLISFLVIAARLLQIKSEALLPRPPSLEPLEEDPGEALAKQLIAYKKFKDVALHLADRSESGLRTYLRLASVPTSESKPDLSGIRLEDLRHAFLAALESTPTSPDFGKVVIAQRIKIRDRIQIIIQALRNSKQITFQKLFKGARTKLEVIVSFLALLELMKQQLVKAEQEGLFGDIAITTGDAWESDQDMDFELEFEG
jgi:segregation and condensation protein A